jgi:hypothetical protein
VEFNGAIPPGRQERAGLEIVRVAACGIAEACVWDADDRLIALLRTAIAELEQAKTSAHRAPEARPAARGEALRPEASLTA